MGHKQTSVAMTQHLHCYLNNLNLPLHFYLLKVGAGTEVGKSDCSHCCQPQKPSAEVDMPSETAPAVWFTLATSVTAFVAWCLQEVCKQTFCWTFCRGCNPFTAGRLWDDLHLGRKHFWSGWLQYGHWFGSKNKDTYMWWMKKLNEKSVVGVTI